MKKEFWRNWKRKTKLEQAGIKSLRQAKKIILQNTPRSEIVAVYVKGSFVTREMNRKSDIDTIAILRTNKYLKKMKKLRDKYRDIYKPKIELSAHPLWELRHNKLCLKLKKPGAKPDVFVGKIKDYKIIYGKEIKPEDFPTRTDKQKLKELIKTFNTEFIPMYKKGNKRMGFSGIIKQIFWLTELEQKIKRIKAKHSFKGITKSIKDKRHIVHDALKLRLHPTKDKTIRRKFITKLKKHLKHLKEIAK